MKVASGEPTGPGAEGEGLDTLPYGRHAVAQRPKRPRGFFLNRLALCVRVKSVAHRVLLLP